MESFSICFVNSSKAESGDTTDVEVVAVAGVMGVNAAVFVVAVTGLGIPVIDGPICA